MLLYILPLHQLAAGREVFGEERPDPPDSLGHDVRFPRDPPKFVSVTMAATCATPAEPAGLRTVLQYPSYNDLAGVREAPKR